MLFKILIRIKNPNGIHIKVFFSAFFFPIFLQMFSIREILYTVLLNIKYKYFFSRNSKIKDTINS